MAKHFRYAYSRSGRGGQPRIHPIASATAIEQGEVVQKSSGLIIATADQDQDDPVFGVSAEGHDGSTSGRNSGTEIKIFDSPDDVFAYTPKAVACTATGGSTTTIEDSSLAGFAANDELNGGYVKIISCAADSSLNGKVVSISDYVASGGVITLSETLSGAIASGDTFYLCPGKIAIGNHAHDLNSDGTDIDWETSGGEALEIYDVDPETFTVFFRIRQHQQADEAQAI